MITITIDQTIIQKSVAEYINNHILKYDRINPESIELSKIGEKEFGTEVFQAELTLEREN